MRTTGGRGTEGWILVIPATAMFVTLTMSTGGPHGMILLLESTIRETITTVVSFVIRMF
jgi:hypothetical protein